MILPHEWSRDLQNLHIVRSVHGTTAIEGNPLSESDVERQLLGASRNRRRDEVHRQTENAARAFRWVESEFSAARRIRLDDILTVHRLLTEESDEHDNAPGRLRESGHNVTVGSADLGGVHRAPPGGTVVRSLAESFINFLNGNAFQRENAAVRALVAHFYFVTLHPFGNGNGRTARCLEAALLYQGQYNTYGFYSLSNYFYRNREAYIRYLQEARTTHRYDLTEFLRFGLRGFREELERINVYIRNRTHRLQYRDMIRRCSEKRIGKRRRLLNEREAKVLHCILDVTTPSDPFSDAGATEATLDGIFPMLKLFYRGKSTRTIARELTRLEELGFIESETEGVGRIVVRFDAIAQY